MTMPVFQRRPVLALVGLMSLAGCGGMVAPDAPALLTPTELAQRQGTAYTATTSTQTASALALRGANLRARAAAARMDSPETAEDRRLAERARRLNEQRL